jgi:hypothetical protein
LLAALVAAGEKYQFRDYVAAEQAVMAIDLQLSTVGMRDAESDWLDMLYAQVGDENAYISAKLTLTMLELEPLSL